MSRPFKCRHIGCTPGTNYFKPRGIPCVELKEVVLTVDEFEAIRLADLEGLYQEDAAKKMKISRQTFGNIIKSSHGKLADALINGKAIKIEGGFYIRTGKRVFLCEDCSHAWERGYGTGRPGACPKCKNSNIHSATFNRRLSRSEACAVEKTRRRLA